MFKNLTPRGKFWLPIIFGVIVAVLVFVLTGCSEKVKEPFRDAPQSGVRNSEPRDIIENPDGFSNLATGCDHGNRFYVPYKGDQNRAAVAVVPNDPSCANSRK